MTFKPARAAGRGRGGARAAPRRPRRTLAGFLALQLLPVAAYAPARTKPARLRLGAATLDPVDLPPQRRLGKLDEGIVRTARSWITEQCFRGWLRDTTKKGCLELDTVDCLEVVEPDECDIGEGLQRQRCPDVIKLSTQGFSWLGFQKLPDGGAKLKATQLETELVNMHRRVLTRGRRGSFRAQLTMTGRDLDASAWIRARLDRVVRRVLTSYMGKEIADDEQMQFRTTIERDGRVVVRGAARVVENRNIMQTPFFYYARRSPPGTAPFRFAASFRLVCEGGAVLFKEPDVYLPDRPSFEAPPPWLWAANPGYAFGLAHAPTSLVEFGQSLFLSSVTVDPTTSFAVTALEPSTSTPGALQVSVEAGPSLAPSRLPTKAPSVTLKRRLARPALFKKKKKRPEPAPTPTPAMMASTAAVIPQTRFVVGENLPWVLNAKNAAPFAVFSSMVFLSILFQLFALPDACFRIAAAVPDALASVEWMSLLALPGKAAVALWNAVCLFPKLCSTIVQAVGANAVAAAPRRRVIVAWHRMTRALRGRRRRPKRRLYRRR